MATRTFTTTCSFDECNSRVYYYPARLVLDSSTGETVSLAENTEVRSVTCSCTGEKGDKKHVMTYQFPTDFKEVK